MGARCIEVRAATRSFGRPHLQHLSHMTGTGRQPKAPADAGILFHPGSSALRRRSRKANSLLTAAGSRGYSLPNTHRLVQTVHSVSRAGAVVVNTHTEVKIQLVTPLWAISQLPAVPRVRPITGMPSQLPPGRPAATRRIPRTAIDAGPCELPRDDGSTVTRRTPPATTSTFFAWTTRRPRDRRRSDSGLRMRCRTDLVRQDDTPRRGEISTDEVGYLPVANNPRKHGTEP